MHDLFMGQKQKLEEKTVSAPKSYLLRLLDPQAPLLHFDLSGRELREFLDLPRPLGRPSGPAHRSVQFAQLAPLVQWHLSFPAFQFRRCVPAGIYKIFLCQKLSKVRAFQFACTCLPSALKKLFSFLPETLQKLLSFLLTGPGKFNPFWH